MTRIRPTLYSDSAEQFKQIKDEIETRRGHDVADAEVVRILMGVWNQADAEDFDIRAV